MPKITTMVELPEGKCKVSVWCGLGDEADDFKFIGMGLPLGINEEELRACEENSRNGR